MKPAHTRFVVMQLPPKRQLSQTGQHVSTIAERARGDAWVGEAVKMRKATAHPRRSDILVPIGLGRKRKG